MNEHIYIIGSGAVGKVLAVALQRSGKKVTIIRGSVDVQSCKMMRGLSGLGRLVR